MSKLAEILAVDPGAIKESTTSDDLAAWDSMGTMKVLYWLNTELGIELGPNETKKLQSVRDIFDLLSTAGKLS